MTSVEPSENEPFVSAGQPALPVMPPSDSPYLPPTRHEPIEAGEPPPFDARALVAAQKRGIANPSYGALPEATPESIAAAKALKDEARRKRRRNRRLGWIVALLLLAIVGTAGFLAYRAYQNDQDRIAAERTAQLEAESDGTSDAADDGAPAALTPLGEQAEVIGALDALDDNPAPSAGGLIGAVKDAETAVGGLNAGATGDAGNAPSATLDIDVVLPDALVRVATRLDDADGFERYLVVAAEFATEDAVAYTRFTETLGSEPQLPADAPAFDVLPTIGTGEIGIAVRRDGSLLAQVVVVGLDPDLFVAHAS
jgi:hypothetical protein